MVKSTYHKLLDAAQNLVQIHGFNAFSYGDLAGIIGITTASIHYHFPTKEDLGEALVRRYREEFNAILETIKTENSDPQTRIEKYAEQFLTCLMPDGKICLCGMLASDYATLPEKMRDHVRAFFSENEAWLAETLEKGKGSGAFVFKSTSADMAMAFFSSLEGGMLDARMFEDDSRLQRIVDCWLESVLHINAVE